MTRIYLLNKKMGNLAFIFLALTTSKLHAIEYKHVALDNIGGSSDFAYSINKAGTIVGMSLDLGDMNLKTTLWEDNQAVDISPSWSHTGNGNSINQFGQVVGVMDGTPTLWNFTNTTTLNKLGIDYGEALAINDHSLIVGYTQTYNDHILRPVLWHGVNTYDLGTLGGPTGLASDINNMGQIVGASDPENKNSQRRATLWENGNIVDLGTLGGERSSAIAINDLGQIAGLSDLENKLQQHATLWKDGSIIDLGTLGGDSSYAESINSFGSIVGQSYITGNYQRHATLWQDGKIYDLNEFIDPVIFGKDWYLERATEINDIGSIVGIAANAASATGQRRAFLLVASPIPEPSTAYLICTGLLLLSFKRFKATPCAAQNR